MKCFCSTLNDNLVYVETVKERFTKLRKNFWMIIHGLDVNIIKAPTYWPVGNNSETRLNSLCSMEKIETKKWVFRELNNYDTTSNFL